MNLNRQFLLIFLTALVFALIQQLLQIGSQIVIRQMMLSQGQPSDIGIFSMIFAYASLAVNPVLAFVAFYYIGKRTDLAKELKSTVVAVIVGNMVAFAIGSAISEVALYAFVPEMAVFLVFTSALSGIYAGNLFVALAGMGVAYARRNKPELAAHHSQASVPGPSPENP